MRSCCGMFLSGLIAVAALAQQQAEAGPRRRKSTPTAWKSVCRKSSRAAPQNWQRCSVRLVSTAQATRS